MRARRPRYVRPRRRGPRAPGPTFTASPGFVADFPLVWGYRCRCHGCRRLVEPGEAIRWVVAGRPGSIYHLDCLARLNGRVAKAA